MRISGGKWAGTKLTSPAGRVRPTSEGVRSIWLGNLDSHLRGSRVLDLFAGTGALGLEALSRGAATCDFVENSPAALHALKANIAATRTRNSTRIFKHDVLRFLEGVEPGRYDLAFADPPYGSQQLDRVVEHWLRDPFAKILTVEHSSDHQLPGNGDSWDFGATTVTAFWSQP